MAKKIKVTVIRPTKPLLLGDFGKVLFITKEADKAYKKYTRCKKRFRSRFQNV